MFQTSTERPPEPGQAASPQADLLDRLGGEPLHGSGYEAEQPEQDFDERS